MSSPENDKKLQAALDLLESADKSVQAARRLLGELAGKRKREPELETSALHQYASGDEKVVEGVFTGDAMLGADKRLYPVPANYASKSLIVQGTKMKARIEPDGKITYKIIEEIPYETRAGILVNDRDRWQAVCGDKVYHVLMASVTFHKAEVGSQVSVRVPAGKEATYAALEAVLPGKIEIPVVPGPAAAAAPAPKAKRRPEPAAPALEIEEVARPAKKKRGSDD